MQMRHFRNEDEEKSGWYEAMKATGDLMRQKLDWWDAGADSQNMEKQKEQAEQEIKDYTSCI